ncbi:MAG: hypothetical protein RJA99_1073 [Pseudomonadota bacterium]|jgi:CRP-like cAMP-binding protein
MSDPASRQDVDLSRGRERERRALALVPWLRDGDPVTHGLLLRRAWLRRYRSGESMVRRGERADGLMVVAAGTVETSSSTAAGRRVVVSYAGPGHVVGLVPLLDGGGAIHDTRAQEPAEVLWIAPDDFHAAIDADPQMRRRVMRLLAGRTRRLHRLLVDTAALPLPVRLARVLLSLRAALGEPAGPGGGLRLRVSQEGLAAMLGVPRQRVNAALRTLAEAGVLRMGYLRIELLDLAALRRCAQEPED